MRTSKVLSKFRAGEFARFSALGHYIPYFIAHSAHAGYDGIWLDLEHRAMDEREVQAMLAFCHAANIDCMVRPDNSGRNRLSRYLEEGATGLMIPFVDTAEEAHRMVRAAKFPPHGNRGIDGVGLDAGYGIATLHSTADYLTHANRETFIVAQIETPEAVENAEEIAAVPGIDLLFLGPGDLGIRLGTDQSTKVKSIDDAIERVAAAAQTHGKSWGTVTASESQMQRFLAMGAQMLPWKSEYYLITKGLDACRLELDELMHSFKSPSLPG